MQNSCHAMELKEIDWRRIWYQVNPLFPDLNVQNNIINTVVKEFNNIMLKAASSI